MESVRGQAQGQQRGGRGRQEAANQGDDLGWQVAQLFVGHLRKVTEAIRAAGVAVLSQEEWERQERLMLLAAQREQLGRNLQSHLAVVGLTVVEEADEEEADD